MTNAKRDPRASTAAPEAAHPAATAPPLTALIARRLRRRQLLTGLPAISAFGLLGGVLLPRAAAAQAGPSSLTFQEIAHGLDAQHHVAPGYGVQVLLRWGDAIRPDAPPFDPLAQSAAAQEKQHGIDSDFIAFLPLPRGTHTADHGLLCINHERTTPHLLFPGMTAKNYAQKMTSEQVEIEMASQGHTIVEVRRAGRTWSVVTDSPYNRRITARSTAIRIAGPAAGHARMQTTADPAGTTVLGTLNNCAGGLTPWGTVLSCEENLHNYFLGDAAKGPEAQTYRRYGITGRGRYIWGRFHDRFHLDKEPHEPNRFGWVVEIDPYEPHSMPVKRTALGRFKHEGATTAVSHDGRLVVYSGDDERFEYLYRFVSTGRYDPTNRTANLHLLDDGVLSVARFDVDGTMTWVPLVQGQGPLTATNGFPSQAEVVIEARRAADLVGATPMDRPEDIEPHPTTGRVYVVLTFNERRKPATEANARQRINPANPRPNNRWGHILELIPPSVDGKPDHTAAAFTWEFFLLAGDPQNPAHGAKYPGPLSAHGWLAAADNLAFDPKGRLWITTDGQDDAAGVADAVYAADTAGPGRGITRLFFNAPRGAEVCGPCFTPDGRTLFLAVQHPADEESSTFDTPSTRWPDFQPSMPPRAAVLAITKDDGGEIGG